MSETVSKTKGPTGTEVTKETIAPRKTVTNWRVLEEGGFIPVRLKCDGYKGNHPSDLACHTNITPDGQTVLRHVDPNHGGGWFKITFRISDGKQSPLWRELEEAGVEIQELYCPHCRENVAMSPRRIIQHLQPHAGANRVNMNPQTLCMTLGFSRADEDEMDALYQSA